MSMHEKHGDRRGRRKLTAGGIVFFSVAALILGFSVSGVWIDKLGQQWVTCEVEAAEATRGGNRSVTSWKVTIETRDCGSIGYSEAYTEEMTRAFAAGLQSGADFEFTLGIVSRMMMKSPIKVITPTAQAIRDIDAAR